MPPPRIQSRVLQSELFMARQLGQVIDHGDCVQVRQPHNPGYYHGNYLLLPGPPEPAEIDAAIVRFQALFADDPRIRHVCLVWDGGPLSDAARAHATSLRVGSAMVHAALEQARADGHRLCFVLGHPEYYPRFGFEPAGHRGFTCHWEVPEPVWMGQVLDGSWPKTGGEVIYPPAFYSL